MLDKPSRLGELETVIERGLTTFVEVGNAIREIRDSKLYKDSHDTFEKYCRERWGWNRNYADKQVRAADTAAVLGTFVPIPNEAVAREFAPLKSDPETMNRVWGGVVEEYGETPAAKHVKKAVQQALTAERIRIQLPPATRTIVENIDPDDCNLPNDPKQLTHLLDVSHKRGDERTAETAERVGNGEFKSTFDAYPEVKEEATKPTPPEPINRPDNIPKDEDFFVSREEDAIHKFPQRRIWYGRLHLDKLKEAARTPEEAREAKDAVRGIIELCTEIEGVLEARERELQPERIRRVK